MVKLLITLGLISIAHIYVGYYTTQDIEDEQDIFFIKKSPTLQVKFKNLYTSNADDKPLASLNMVEVNIIRNYCKYRLGIETRLDNQVELEACKKR